MVNNFQGMDRGRQTETGGWSVRGAWTNHGDTVIEKFQQARILVPVKI